MSTKRVRKPAPKKLPAKKAPKKEAPLTLQQRLKQIRGMKAQSEIQMRQCQANVHGFEGQILLLERMIEEEDAKKEA